MFALLFIVLSYWNVSGIHMDIYRMQIELLLYTDESLWGRDSC
jgi:hypothetical protein